MSNRLYFFLATILCFLRCAPAVEAGDVIDRVVARVNGQVILLSDWDEELCFEAFEEARPPDRFLPAERQAALDRLIDRQLMREQLRLLESVPADTSSVQSRIAEIRAAHAAKTDASWQSALQRYGLTEAELSRRVASELNLMQSVDARLRPNVQIDEASVDSYYKEKLSSGIARTGTAPPPEIAVKIKQILTEQKMNDLLSTWLQALRSEGEIRTFTPFNTAAPPGGGAR